MAKVAKVVEHDPYKMAPDETVFEHVRQMYQDSQERRVVHDDTRKVIRQTYKPAVPDSMVDVATVIKSATGAGVVGRLAGYFTVKPRYDVVPDESRGTSGQARATKIERFLNAALTQLSMDAGVNLWALGVTDVVSLGLTGFQVAWNPGAWKGIPDRYEPRDEDDIDTQALKLKESRDTVNEWKQREGRMPITLRHVSGYSVYFSRDANGLAEVFDIEYQDVRSIVSRYPKSNFAKRWQEREKRDRVTMRSVPVCHYANRKYCAVMLFPSMESPSESALPQTEEPEQEFLEKAYPHLIENDVPYAIVPGLYTGVKEIGHDIVGPLYHVRDLIVKRDTLLTYKATSQRQKVFMNWVMKHNEWPEIDEETAQVKEYKIREGEVWHIRTEEDVQPLEAHGDPVFDDVIAALSEAIERQTIPGPGFGLPQGISSGYMANTLQVAGTLHFEPVQQHLKDGLERIGLLILQYVQASGQTVWVRNHGKSGYLGLSPDDIGNYLPELNATVREKAPMDYPTLVQTANTAKGSRLWDPFSARETAPPPNGLGPEEIEQRIQAYDMVNSQPVQKLMLDRLMADINSKFDARARMANSLTPQQIAAMPPEAQMAAFQMALAHVQQGGSFPPAVFEALAAGGAAAGVPPPTVAPPGAMPMPPGGGGGVPPIPGAPNMNMLGGPPAIPPPTSGIGAGQAPQMGGRRAGSRRQPSGPQGPVGY